MVKWPCYSAGTGIGQSQFYTLFALIYQYKAIIGYTFVKTNKEKTNATRGQCKTVHEQTKAYENQTIFMAILGRLEGPFKDIVSGDG